LIRGQASKSEVTRRKFRFQVSIGLSLAPRRNVRPPSSRRISGVQIVQIRICALYSIQCLFVCFFLFHFLFDRIWTHSRTFPSICLPPSLPFRASCSCSVFVSALSGSSGSWSRVPVSESAYAVRRGRNTEVCRNLGGRTFYTIDAHPPISQLSNSLIQTF
jgi:hypothetical protein